MAAFDVIFNSYRSKVGVVRLHFKLLNLLQIIKHNGALVLKANYITISRCLNPPRIQTPEWTEVKVKR